MFANAAWKSALAGAGDGVAEVQLLRLVLADRIREAVTELLVAERDRAVPVRRVAQGNAGRAQRRDRQREHAPERSRADRDRRGGESAPRENHGQQTAERVTDDHGLPMKVADDRLLVVGDLLDSFAREHFGMLS